MLNVDCVLIRIIVNGNNLLELVCFSLLYFLIHGNFRSESYRPVTTAIAYSQIH